LNHSLLVHRNIRLVPLSDRCLLAALS